MVSIKIKKVFNNNIVLVEDEDHQQMILMRKGIGFQKKANQTILPNQADQIFLPDKQDQRDKWLQTFDALAQEIPPQYFSLTEKIIQNAQAALNQKLNNYLLITLTDHIHFALERHKAGNDIANPLKWEVQQYYPAEYQLGLDSLALINETFDVDLPADEGAFIALHFIENEQISKKPNMHETLDQTSMIHDIMRIVKYDYNLGLDSESVSYQRFIVHLRYFILHVSQGEVPDEIPTKADLEVFHKVANQYEQSFETTQKIVAYIKEKTGQNVSIQEQTYLTIHIQRVTN